LEKKILINIGVSVLILLLQLLVLEPILGTRWGWVFIVLILYFLLVFEYYFNKLFPKIGLKKFSYYFDASISYIKKLLSPVFSALKIASKKILELSAYFVVIFSFLIIFLWDALFFQLESNILEFQEISGTSFSPKTFVSIIFIAWYFLSLFLLSFIEVKISQVSRVIVTACTAVVVLTIFSSIYGYEFLVKKTELVYLAIILATIWVVALKVLASQNKQFEYLDDIVTFLMDVPEISSLFTKESLKLTKIIQKGWLKFIYHPWADDYISSIKDCIPIKCEGYLLTIGYMTSQEERMLENVQSALQEDIQKYFKIKRLKIRFEKIEISDHRKIVKILRKYDSQVGK